MTKLLSMLLLVPVFSAGLIAADLTGQWSLELQPDFSGNNDTIACSFVQQQENLTLNCGAAPAIHGDGHGRTVTFHFNTGTRNEASASYTGELNAQETTITGTWHLSTKDRGPVDGKFLAKKLSDKK